MADSFGLRAYMLSMPTKETFSRYDTADYLKTEEDIAAYLEAVIEEAGDDPAFVASALGVVARALGLRLKFQSTQPVA